MSALLERLTRTTPPVMPETVARLQALRAREEVTRHPDIGRILLDDPAATVAVFRELERTRPGSFAQVADTAHAVSLLGVARFQQLVDGLPRVADRDKPHSSGIGTALARGAHAAHFAAAIARYKGLPGETEVKTAALLQNLVWLAFWATTPDQASQVAVTVRGGESLERALQQAVGEPLAELNGMLARAWAMPMLAQQAARPVPADTLPKLGAVRLADEVATATSAGWQHPMVAALPDRMAEFLSLEPDAATRWLHEQATEIARELSAYPYPLAGYDLLLLPVGGGEAQQPAPTAAEGQVLQTAAKQRPNRHAAPAGAPLKSTRGTQKAQPSLHDTMIDIMRRIRAETGANRVLFAMLSSDRRHLRTRLVLGGQRNDALRRLDLDAGGRHLFGALMKRSQSVWLTGGNATRYQPLLNDQLRETIRPDSAYLMSLFVRGRALGLLYGDGDALSDAGYRRFRMLCNTATDALAG